MGETAVPEPNLGSASFRRCNWVRRGTFYHCPVCDKKYTGTNAVEAHMSYHTGVKLYRCDTCGRRFANRGSWRRHLICIHNQC
ncbi:hypothetical protein LSH36_147g01000 [Paralvinella palmiformis]|uniref:C2H2-type domain-containing protein n=1 Tax=Paralvinella palmiformis TaxID=53620 RepID=A0AAD9JWF5_9ANNE|nr:hypothetical protein LSH36_147g01000 [Paralvinella palmiformis]